MNVEDGDEARQKRLLLQRKLLGQLKDWGEKAVIEQFSDPSVERDRSWIVRANLAWKKNDLITHAVLRQSIMDFADEVALEVSGVVANADLNPSVIQHDYDRISADMFICVIDAK
jgi:hypothetical protein